MSRKFGIKVCIIDCPDGRDGGGLSSAEVADLLPTDTLDNGHSEMLVTTL
jgi:hypothetical protein